jgi:hypothetical protein
MADIRHIVRIEGSPKEVFEAVSSPSRWWTPRVEGEGDPHGPLTLHFGHWDGRTDLRVVDRVPGERLVWEVMANNEGDEWPGTRITFDLEGDERGTLLRFGHCGWRDATDYFGECNGFWGYFMQSLKRLVETGRGSPR